jgi:hypothetical protein
MEVKLMSKTRFDRYLLGVLLTILGCVGVGAGGEAALWFVTARLMLVTGIVIPGILSLVVGRYLMLRHNK